MTQEVPDGQPSAQPPPGWPYGDPPAPPSGAHPAGVSGGELPPRPSRWWWITGVGLIVTAVVSLVLFTGLAIWQGISVFDDAADVRVPSQSQVDLPAGDKRMLYARPGATPDCTLADTGGTALPLSALSGSVSVSLNGDDWEGVGTFRTGNGHVLLTCTGADGVVRVGKVFGGASFVITILLAVLLPIVLGLAGFGLLAVAGIKTVRHRRA